MTRLSAAVVVIVLCLLVGGLCSAVFYRSAGARARRRRTPSISSHSLHFNGLRPVLLKAGSPFSIWSSRCIGSRSRLLLSSLASFFF
jgi:hypothetical protein